MARPPKVGRVRPRDARRTSSASVRSCFCERGYESRAKRPPMVERVRRRTLLVLALVSAFGTSCRSSDSAAPSPGSADVVPVETGKVSPLLWAAEKAGNTTYLLGTMHLGVDAARLPASAWQKLDAAKSFAMETDLSDPAVRNLTKRDAGTIHDDLGDEYWHKLEAAVTPRGA